ncbi:MAG: phage tail tube protein [Sphingomonadaceae bacterium]
MSVPDTTVLLAKVEDPVGTWANPVPATDAMLVFDYEVEPMEAEQVRRQVERPFSGVAESSYTAIRARHRFSVELAGSGTVDTPTFWARLLRGCMFQTPDITATEKVTYPLVPASDGAAISLAGNKGNARHRGRMSRGNAVLRFTEKQLPSIGFDFMSLIEGTLPMDPFAPSGVVLPSYPVPAEVSLLNTAIQLDGFALGVRSLEIDLGNKVEFYSHTGTRAVLFGKDDSGDRRSVTARAVFELPDPAVKNFFASILPRTKLPFSLVHGTDAGNIIEITSAAAVIGQATYSVEQNRMFMNCPIEFVPTAGGNELSLVTR